MEETPVPDLATLVENLRNQRFDGYGPVRIANEIDEFRTGTGIGSISAAVDALDAVASSLAETESTLRSELGKLGVSWRGESALAAAAEVTEDADFASTMKERLDSASRALFAQGESFNRTRHKLPEAELVRKAIGGTDFGDTLLSLIGIETDHAEQVAKAREATEHAAQVLNEYAMDSANHLETAEPAPDTGTLGFTVATRVPTAVVASGHPDTGSVSPSDPPAAASVAPPSAEDSSTTAAACATDPVTRPPATPGGSQPRPAGTAPYSDAPPPPRPVPNPAAPPTGGEPNGDDHQAEEWCAPDDSTSVSGVVPTVPTVPGTPLASAGYPGVIPSTGSHGSVSGGAPSSGYSSSYSSGTAPAPGRWTGAAPPSGLRSAGRMPTGFGVAPPGVQPPTGTGTGRPLIPIRPGNTSEGESLARGRTSGLTALSRTENGYLGSTYVPRPRGGPSAGHVGAGITAFGAGATGAASATGDQERQGRGVGRSAPHAGTSHRQMTFRSTPDEDEARDGATVTHRAENGARNHRQAGVLERAAMREDEGSEHVRSRGIEDTDLFSDHRMVSPASIEPDPRGDVEA